jgi:hypothetical protein
VFENGKPKRRIRLATTKKQTVVTGLRRGALYTFKIAAINGKGVGYYSTLTKPVRVK